MKEKILVLLYNDFVAYEIALATFLLSEEFEYVMVSPEPGPLREWGGFSVNSAKLIGEIDLETEDYKALIIPGGKWQSMLANEEVTTLIQKCSEKGMLLAAICAAPIHLAKAGILCNHRFATSLGPVDDPDQYFPWDNFTKDGVVIDGNVITADGNASVDFAIAICDYFHLFENVERREKVRKYYKNIS